MAQIPLTRESENDQTGHLLKFSDEAILLLKDWEDEVELMFQIGGVLEDLTAWGAKLVGQTIRITGLIHCVQHAESGVPWNQKIEIGTLKSAITISRYAVPHAGKAYNLGNQNVRLNDTIYLWKLIQSKKKAEFSRRELQRINPNRFPKANDLNKPLETLIAHGYLRKLNFEQKKTPGQNSSQRFEVNPELIRQFS